MIVKLPEEVIFKLIDYAKDAGRKEEKISSGKEPQFINQSQAHKKYGRCNVERWVRSGLVRKYKDADGKARSSARYNELELNAAAFKCNYIRELSPMAKGEMRDIINQLNNPL